MTRPSLALALLAAAAATALPPRPVRADDPAPGAKPGPAPEAKPEPKADPEREKKVEALLGRLASADKAVRRAAAEEAAAEQDPRVSAALVKAAADPDRGVRLAVAAALGARKEDAARKEAGTTLLARVERLVQYADMQDELVAVFGALHDLALPSTVLPIVEPIDLTRREPAILEARLRAVANVPTNEAVSELIGLLAKGGRGGNAWWKRAVRDALVYATGEKIGPDADAWRAWWKEHEKGFDHAAAAARRARERAAKKK